jgi:hypothetical protein
MTKPRRAARPRQIDAPRQPDGWAQPEPLRPSPEAEARRPELLGVLIARHLEKIAAPIALDSDAGLHIAWLYLVGPLTERQRDAVERYWRATVAYEACLRWMVLQSSQPLPTLRGSAPRQGQCRSTIAEPVSAPFPSGNVHPLPGEGTRR